MMNNNNFEATGLNVLDIEGREYVVIAVHNGVFHADDVLCVAMLKYAYAGRKEIRVIRSRDPKELEGCDYVLDVGNKDSVTDNQVCLDHHNGKPDYYSNGIKYAACGKLADVLFVDCPEVLTELRKQLLWPIEAQDNGQDATKFPFSIMANKFNFVPCFLPTWIEQENDKNLFDKAFEQCLEMAVTVFHLVMNQIAATIKAKDVVRKSRISNGVLYLSKPLPWQEPVINWNNELIAKGSGEIIKLVRFEATNHMLQVVPKELGSFDSWIKLPAHWAGKKGGELAAAIGLSAEDCIFCHPARFLAGFASKEAADKAAEIALEAATH